MKMKKGLIAIIAVVAAIAVVAIALGGSYNGFVDKEEAVKTAHAKAEAGDIVTLSPACASFDAYPNFMARGNHFKELVGEL